MRRRQIRPATEKRKLAALARFAPHLCDGRASAPEGNNDNEELELTFVEAMTRAGWVLAFDWATWAQSAEGQRLLGEPHHIASATPDQLGKVLTALIRGERFSEGTLNDALQSGLLLAIARRAEALLDLPQAAATIADAHAPSPGTVVID
jgi:hypothetical protein